MGLPHTSIVCHRQRSTTLLHCLCPARLRGAPPYHCGIQDGIIVDLQGQGQAAAHCAVTLPAASWNSRLLGTSLLARNSNSAPALPPLSARWPSTPCACGQSRAGPHREGVLGILVLVIGDKGVQQLGLGELAAGARPVGNARPLAADGGGIQRQAGCMAAGGEVNKQGMGSLSGGSFACRPLRAPPA